MAIGPVIAEIFLFSTSFTGILFGIANALSVIAIDMHEIKGSSEELAEKEAFIEEGDDHGRDRIDPKKVETVEEATFDLMLNLAGKIKDGANNFLFKEYFYLAIFCVVFGLIVLFCAETKLG